MPIKGEMEEDPVISSAWADNLQAAANRALAQVAQGEADEEGEKGQGKKRSFEQMSKGGGKGWGYDQWQGWGYDQWAYQQWQAEELLGAALILSMVEGSGGKGCKGGSKDTTKGKGGLRTQGGDKDFSYGHRCKDPESIDLPGATEEEVEEFLRSEAFDEPSQAGMKTMHPKFQKLVIAMGPCTDARDPSKMLSYRCHRCAVMRQSEWICPGCYSINKTSIKVCRTCNESKPESDSAPSAA